MMVASAIEAYAQIFSKSAEKICADAEKNREQKSCKMTRIEQIENDLPRM